ncbi:MAG TPA: ABC transporter substrate-binding protein [Burkholderiaceae bacterium]|nr:ABC transporter substrate-binding protein [Burkholderiaceae bacterium]
MPQALIPARLAAAALALALAAPVLAQIRIGQTAGLTGTVAGSVAETVQGARLVIDATNAQGGVNGQRIELITLDDRFDPKLAAENAARLLDEQRVSALFLTRGTPHTEAILPLLAQYKVPLIAPSTGAMLLHRPVNPWVFNVRSSYQREAEHAVRQLASMSMQRIGLVQVSDSFGNDGVEGAKRGFEAAKIEPAFHLKYDRSKPDFAELVTTAQAKQPQAVVFVGSQQHVADGTKALRAAGVRAQIVTLSNNASGGFIKALGDAAQGTIVTQVFPSERNTAMPMVRDLTALARAKGIETVTPSMMEGYAAARVLVEALKRAGKEPTPERIVKALEGMSRFDLGGVEVGFSPTDHTGMDYADISIVGRDGRFLR